MDLRSAKYDRKARRQQRIELIRAHPHASEEDIVAMLRDQRLYARNTWTKDIIFAIREARIDEQLERQGTITLKTDLPSGSIQTEEAERYRLARYVEHQRARIHMENAAVLIKKRVALEAIGEFLISCGWSKLSAREPLRGRHLKDPDYYIDPETRCEHRVDMAFFIAAERDFETRRRADLL